MSRILDKAVVVIWFAIAILPIVARELHIADRPIDGVLVNAKKPELSFDSIWSEHFQTEYTAWFEKELGLKGYSVMADNTTLYRVFGETKPGAPVRTSKGNLFKDEDITFYNKHGSALPSTAKVEALADQIARVQEQLRAQHRALVPVLVPSKSSIYPDSISAEWTMDLGQPRPSETAIYRETLRALDARHVRYIDARAMLTASPQPRAIIWGLEARHWSSYSACLVLQRALTLTDELIGTTTPPYDCPVTMEPRSRWHDDFDLARLLNVAGSVGDTPVPVVPHAPAPPYIPRHKLMVMGTSFCWTILHDAEASGWFEQSRMNSYNAVLVDEGGPNPIQKRSEPHTPDWDSFMTTSDIYVLDLFETYLHDDGSYVLTILDGLAESFARSAR